jgi:hypothetical protein
VQRPQPVLETGATLDDVFAHYAGHSLDDLAVAGGSRR